MPKYDTKHPDAKRMQVHDEAGNRLRGVIEVDTDNGYLKCYDLEERKREDIKDEHGQVKLIAEPVYGIKKDENGKPIILTKFGKFTVQFRDEVSIDNVPPGYKPNPNYKATEEEK